MKAPYPGDRLEADKAPVQVLLVVDRAAVKRVQHSWEVQSMLLVADRGDMPVAADIAAVPGHIVVVAYRVAAVVAHRVAAYPGHSR